LVFAMRSGCGKCVEALLGSVDGPALNVPLVALAPFGNAQDVQMLLERGADVNARLAGLRIDLNGRTPLMLAASSDLLPVDAVNVLIVRGADVNLKGPAGETALDLAKRNGNTAVVDVLVKAGAKEGGSFRGAAVTPSPASSVRSALERSIPLLQRSDETFIRKTGCVSCHNDTFAAMMVAVVRENGLPVDEQIAQQQPKRTASFLDAKRGAILQGADIPSALSNILVGMAAEHHAPDLSTDAVAYYLKNLQLPDGRWREFWIDHRPPIQSSEITLTGAAIRALRVYAPKARRIEYEKAVDRAATWLMKAEPKMTDERALQLLGLTWAGVRGHNVVRQRARELLAEQRSDGGWAQLPSLASDAYATGQALVALKEAGGLRVTDAAYARGVRFLLNSQLGDGSWYVKTRAIPFQPYFESDFPHGVDQWISVAATNWAAMALAPAAR
jgi:Ankyrin repeat